MSSSLSRAELEAMDHEELVATVEWLQDRVDDLEAETDRLDALVVKAHEKLQAVDELAGRVDDLEAENERLRSRVDGADSKDEKVAAIVEHATNLRDPGDRAVKLTAKHIKGATGVSRRYAYDLMDPADDNSLVNQYDWILTPAEMQQYGSLELDLSGQQKCIAIDFEGVHSAGCPVNKFTTADGGESGE